ADSGKGLNVLLEVALSEAAQLKEATKRSKKDFRISQASGLESDKESWGDNKEEDDDEDDTEDESDDDDNGDSNDNDDDNDDERTESDIDKILDPNKTNKEHQEDDKYNDDRMDEVEDNNVIKELYKDMNVNLGNKDVDMTEAEQGGADQHNVSHRSGFEQEEEDSYVTLTAVHDKTEGPMQSSSVSSDFTSKLLNLENRSPDDSDIASLMNTATIHPPLPLINLL
nr:hypothetical protein [Tanacetum cinerariifolium]